jgi:carbamoyltransferase
MMSQVFGRYGAAHPWLGSVASQAAAPLSRAFFAARHFYRADSRVAAERGIAFRERLDRGERIYLLGIGPSGHNAGAALVEASRDGGVRMICNEEEERYTGVKHHSGYPSCSVMAVRDRLTQLGVAPREIHACLASWSYPDFIPFGARAAFDHAPASLALARPASSPKFNTGHVLRASAAPRRLGEQLGLGRPMPIIGMRHHANHACFAYAVSPFSRDADPVMVAVLDGYGEDASVSLYLGRDGRLRRVRSNESLMDSLGALYSALSSTQGGWTTLSSEGRYMGAAAWGNTDRLTNPHYLQLRQLIYFDHGGRFHLNRAMANWHKYGEVRPYTRPLARLLGEPIPPKDMWRPDCVLRVEDVRLSPFTQDRLDKAAAVQMLFEDVVFHVVGHFIRETGSRKLILSGGCALNCVANMKLLDRFDGAFYQRYIGERARLHLWIPPTPSDQGVVPGAAFNFAMSHGAEPGPPLQHAFYCGTEPRSADIRDALRQAPEIQHFEIGTMSSDGRHEELADFAAYVVSQDGILGLFQGVAETGPRALGHRSILANPCNPATLDNINRLVKYRERIRPLAPMATLDAAQHYFELAPGASDADYNAYNYMVLTARARQASHAVIPAVIHRDGTARVQIVRDDPPNRFTFAFLRAMGRRVGVEMSVNTSLNVGTPIVQTPAQALEALKRAKGMTCLILIGAEGTAFVAWHNVINPPKDAGASLLAWYGEWRAGVRQLVV